LLKLSYLTYFLPHFHFHLSIHLDDFRHPEDGNSIFLQNIRTNKKHITWYKIPKDDLNLYLTVWHYIPGTGGFTVKLKKLKLQGSSLAWAPSKALGGAPQ
jgi:hypothetical protein